MEDAARDGRDPKRERAGHSGPRAADDVGARDAVLRRGRRRGLAGLGQPQHPAGRCPRGGPEAAWGVWVPTRGGPRAGAGDSPPRRLPGAGRVRPPAGVRLTAVRGSAERSLAAGQQQRHARRLRHPGEELVLEQANQPPQAAALVAEVDSEPELGIPHNIVPQHLRQLLGAGAVVEQVAPHDEVKVRGKLPWGWLGPVQDLRFDTAAVRLHFCIGLQQLIEFLNV
mmetsp:Transcript_12914/g.30633  ORF Transcript_12914/g.30633 Transcript_12914/m.30633 type:complete len:226 (-) Transcript_12914:96-773(-)